MAAIGWAFLVGVDIYATIVSSEQSTIGSVARS